MVTWMPKRLVVSGETIPEVKPSLAFWGVAKRSRLVFTLPRFQLYGVDDLGPDAVLYRSSLEQSCVPHWTQSRTLVSDQVKNFLIYTARCWKMGTEDQQKVVRGQIELVAGVSGANEMKPVPSYPQGSKPWWWYLVAFPSGAQSLRMGSWNLLSAMEVDEVCRSSRPVKMSRKK
jgi:hypothetical protein